jgi:hypothetical protein
LHKLITRISTGLATAGDFRMTADIAQTLKATIVASAPSVGDYVDVTPGNDKRVSGKTPFPTGKTT